MLTLTLTGCAGSADQDEPVVEYRLTTQEATNDLAYLRTDIAGLSRGSVVDEPPAQPEALPGLPDDPAADGATAASIGYVGQLTHDELRSVLGAAGWPEALWDDAARVVECESRRSPGAIGDSGRSVGLFQLNRATWFRYAGESDDDWSVFDPIVNSRTAYAVYLYDIGRGYEPWKQWSCGYAASQ